ncbi:MAG: trimethylamine methyltransferase family protein [Desulfitobacteriaceae bacterium]|nr:trimethylamine methyltransferase family protein [Desulfitobacteriaceae bacterium]
MQRINKTGLNYLSGFGLASLSKEQVESIHYATLEVLGKTGIKIESDEATELFASAGAKVERHEGYAIVRIPPYLVEDCIRWAARPMTLFGRVPEDDFIAEPNRVGFSTFGECIQVIDPVTRKIRKSLKKDCGDISRICDYLGEINVMERPCCSSDANPETQPLHNVEAMFTNTSKSVFIASVNAANCRKMVEMAAACVGGMENFRKRPFLNIFVCPTSPLTLVKNCCEVIIEAARLGAGIAIIPMALAGATSTVTLAGTLVTHNAEVLSSLILAQLAAKGARCVYCSVSTIMDLKLMVGAIGAPEQGLLSAGAAKMAQYYRLPSWIGGGISDSKIPDAQAGYEFMMNALLGALAGANIVYGAGVLELGLTQDYAKLVLDAEAIKGIRRITQGIDLSDEQLALDVIHEVGPGGEFLTHMHTFNHMKKQSQPKLFDRRNRDGWVAAGQKDAAERAYEEAAYILKNHKPKPLPPGAADKMRSIIEDYEEELGIVKR